MKTVKFKDLPGKVQGFVNRMIGKVFDPNDNIPLNWLHSIVNWSKATDEERLAYARWKYPIGVKFIDYQTNGTLTSAGKSFSLAWFYDYAKNKWAEIISEPEKIDWSKANKDNIPLEDEPGGEEPTFKAGDEVDVKNYEALWVNGAETSKIIHINGDSAWVINSQFSRGIIVPLCDLRLSHNNDVYREMAKEFLREKVYEFENLSYHTIEKQGLIELVTEAIKKGKEL